MWGYSRKKINNKELEYKRVRSVSKKENRFRLLRSFYRTLFYFLAVSFGAVSVYVIFFSPFLSVTSVEIAGVDKIGMADVVAVAESQYKGRYLGFLPKDNFVIFPEKKIAAAIKENFKRISDVNVEKKFPDSVVIFIEERDSLLLWRVQGNKSFIIDENGYAYHEVALDSREVLENDLLEVFGPSEEPVFEGDRDRKSVV